MAKYSISKLLKTTGCYSRIIYSLLFPHPEKSLSKFSENRKSGRIIAAPGGGGQIPGGILPKTGVGSRAKNREIKWWVLDNNENAQALYRKHGFYMTGKMHPLSEQLSELEMEI